MESSVYGLAILAEQGNVLAVDATAAVVFFTSFVLVWVLDKLLFRPLNNVLEERDRRTLGYQAEAQAMLAETDHKLNRYEAEMRQARAETYEMLEQRRQEALNHRTRLIEAAKQEVTEEIVEARGQLQQQMQETKQELATQCQDIATRIVTGLLDRPTQEVKRSS